MRIPLLLIMLIFSTYSLSAQTLEDKIGQMLIVGFRGTEVNSTDIIARDIQNRNLGSVVLYETDNSTNDSERNIKSKEQLTSLITKLQSLSDQTLIVAIDQEGGQVQRLKPNHGFEKYPSHLELGNEDDPEKTKRVAYNIGQEIKSVGINLNFAPVTDVMVNRQSRIISRLYRSFSDNPEEVYEHAKAYIQGLHESGVISVIKHFPGFGSERSKKTRGMYDLTETWSENELIPYKRLFADEEVTVDAVMVSHIFNTNHDQNFPASLSSNVITDLLRDELGFTGVIIGESPQATFIIDEYGLENAIRQQVKAGVDMLQFANNIIYDPQITQKTVTIIKRMVEDGEISEEQINASYERIMAMKQQLK